MFPLAGGAPQSATYVDDVFSTFLYTGTGSAQTITNGVDLANRGGMVWIKARDSSSATTGHALFDTLQSRDFGLASQSTAARVGPSSANTDLQSFNSTGFTVAGNNQWAINASGTAFASWTFRRAAKFFDVVTGTGPGTFSHSIGAVPGCLIFKRTNVVADWIVNHTSMSGGINGGFYCPLNTTAAQTNIVSNFSITSTNFSPSAFVGSSDTWVAYFFADDSASNGVIRCGGYTGNGSATGPIVALGWEPQWLMIKRISGGTGDWKIFDSMRGLTVSGQNDAYIAANAVAVEASADWIAPTATGFQITTTSTELNNNTDTYIYVAIRRPNKPPTTGTSVFIPIAGGFSGSNDTDPSNAWDFGIARDRDALTTTGFYVADRLRGIGANSTSNSQLLNTNSTSAESAGTQLTKFAPERGWTGTGNVDIAWLFKRAPGFFDIVCYTGTGANQSITHNLGAVPELIFIKNRASIQNWGVYYGVNTAGMNLNTTGIPTTSATFWNNTSPTVSAFTVGTSSSVNGSTNGMVAYLFATVAGVSKVGTYTGNGSSQTINCGFSAGARFVLIKRTDSTGDWYVWDTARGIVAANDPHLSVNTTAAEVTTDDSIDTDTTGFVVNQLAATNVNVNTATYIYLAIA